MWNILSIKSAPQITDTRYKQRANIRLTFKEIVHLKIKLAENVLNIMMNDHQYEDEFVVRENRNRIESIALDHLLTNASSAVNGCRQNEIPNSW